MKFTTRMYWVTLVLGLLSWTASAQISGQPARRLVRMSDAQAGTCTTAKKGTVYYSTTSDGAFYCDGSTWTAMGVIGGGSGDALTTNPLSQFAATTSAQLAGVLSDETGSGGGFVRATAPTIDSPIITTKARLPRVTALPGTPSAGDTVIVTDDSATGACDSSAGSATTLCQYNGSAWVALGDGGSGGGGLSSTDIDTSAELAAILGDETGNGGGFVRANNATLVAPALGTPASGTLTNATGLPVSTGISGLGTGVATALAANANATGGVVTVDGTATLTNKTLTSPVIGTKVNLPRVTALPGTPSAGDTVIVTDDSAAGACDSAAGSATTLCQYNGSAWVKLGDGTGAGGSLASSDIDTSAEIAAIVGDETGSDALVFQTSPTLTTPRITTAINDTNGNEIIKTPATTSAVNELTITNSATGNPVSVAATGDDTNISLNLTPKGTGTVNVTGSTTGVIGLIDTDQSHYLNITPGSNLTADRTLTITTGDAARTVTINGDVTLPAGTALVNGGALGTPSSGTLTNATGLPVSTGISGLGTGVATALAVNTGSAGAPVLFNGALGTPSSGTLTNATGLPVAGITASTSTALGVGSVELGHASDTTIARSGAGAITVEGVDVPTISSTSTFTNKTYDTAATGNVFTSTHKTYAGAAGCNNATAYSFYSLFTSLQPTATCVTGTNRQKGVLAFPDSDGEYQAQLETLLPSDWSGSVDVKIRWYAAATSGDVVWQVACSCVADGETDDPSFNSASTVTDTAKGTTLQMNDATITGLTATGCAAGEMMNLKVFRNRTHASDTITGVVNLVGIEITTTRVQ